MKTDTIHLPEKISEKNVFAILALLMHESAHIAYSKEAFEKCVDPDDDVGKHIFNVIEDVRVDDKNFSKLSNIRSFYERLIKDHCNYTGQKRDDVEFQVKILINAIFRLEGFTQYAFDDDQAVNEFLDDNPLENLIRQGGGFIEQQDWTSTRKVIQDIKDLLKMAQQQHQKKTGKGQGQIGLNGIEKLLHPNSAYSLDGKELSGKSASDVGEVALEEQTINQFKELLNIKERKVVEDGTVLDTDNLVAYLTGEIEELFKDDVYIKRKKSKILFLLDASGSMSESMIDQNQRYKVVAKCTERISRILKEVQETEGINVDWEMTQFESSGMEKLDKNTWKDHYGAGGGTNLSLAFKEAVEYMQKDYTIDGKKMIIVMTDGEVGDNQIEEMKRMIIHYNSEVRALVIGIGTDPAGEMATKILGDNLILAEEHANEVILETIRSLL